MAIPSWPKGLKGCITTTKQRTQSQGFKYSDVNAGPAFLELVTDDETTTWDIGFKFNRDQARWFRSWLVETGFNKKPTWFTFPIQIEEGLTDQTVRFMGRVQCTGQDGDVFSYSAVIMCRGENSDDDKYPGAIIAMSELNPCDGIEKSGSIFDIAINDSWP